jgi:bacillaene synthase trans-acting acyltransferase
MIQSMKHPIVFMFSGQGSQYFRMGEELYENNLKFKMWMDHCDRLAAPLIQESLVDIIYRQGGKTKPFDRLLHSSPALLCIEYSLARLLMDMGVQPDYLLGYSLGEITACVISGALRLEDAIALTVEFSRLLENESVAAGMLAIIESEEIIKQFPELFQNCSVTGRNFQKNFVVSGPYSDIRRVQKGLEQKTILTQWLPVNYGFHTALIDSFEKAFKALASEFDFAPIRIPVISALLSGRVEKVSDAYLWEVVRYPVHFERTVRTLLQRESPVFIDVGPSGTLATSVKYLLPEGSDAIHLEMINQYGQDKRSLDSLKQTLERLNVWRSG